MKKSLRVRKRKAAERVRQRAMAAKGKVRAEDAAVSAALASSFYQLPFDVSHIRIQDAEEVE